MKNALVLIVKFVVAHITLLLACAVVYYTYLESTQIVAGKPMAFLPVSSIFFMLPYVASGVSIASGLIVLGSLVSKKSGFFSQITGAALILATWIVILPASFTILPKIFPAKSAVTPLHEVSAGFFRPYRDGVFYSTQEGSTVAGVFFSSKRQ